MKRNSIFFLVLIVLSLLLIAVPAFAVSTPDYSYYANQAKVINIPISSLPQVIEFTIPEKTYTNPFSALLLDETTKQPVNYFLLTHSKVLPLPYSVSVLKPFGQDGNNLSDSNETTYVDFPAESLAQEDNSLIKISALAGKKLSISGIYFEYAQNSSEDFTITIRALKSNGEKVIVVSQKTSMSSRMIDFPQVESQEFELQLAHKQLLRITEIKPNLVNSSEKVATTYDLRFVSQSNHTYTLYTDKDTYAPFRNYNTESQLLNPVGNTITRANLGVSKLNTEYQTPDTDGDSIPNSRDNCPQLSNRDQKDDNHNGVGDACDDFDQDGIFNTVDNCPLLSNPNQEDKDADGIGDVCDGVESRISEKYPWLPWLGIVVGFTFTGGILIMSLKQKKEL